MKEKITVGNYLEVFDDYIVEEGDQFFWN